MGVMTRSDEEKFIDEYNNLNKEQQLVVDTIHTNLITLSPAGTGKTKAMALRSTNIIRSGYDPTEILCLTFTNKACKEIKDRIIDIVGKEGLAITVKTFHSFCFEIIKNEAKRNTDISVDFLIFDEEDCKEIIQEILKTKKDVYPIQTFIEEIKAYSINYSHGDYEIIVKDYFKEYERKYLSKIAKVENKNALLDYLKEKGDKIVAEYNKVLYERHGLDFTDLIINTHKLLKNEQILNRWKSKFSFIQVDEVQDTSILEYKIISKIAGNSNISFFGDINQTIYEWRGSKPFEILEKFKIEHGPIKEIFFQTNYRSTKNLIEASHNYIKNCPDNIENIVKKIDIKSNSHEIGNKIFLHVEDKIHLEAEWICKEIKRKYKDDLSKVAVLTRNNYINKEISAVFERRGVPCFLIDEFKFFRRQEIKDVLAYLKLALNQYDSSSMKRILLRFVKNMGQKTIDKLESTQMKEIGLRLTDFIDENTLLYEEPYKLLLDDIEKRNVVVFDVESTGIDTTKDEIIQIAAIKIDDQGYVKKFERILKNTIPVGTSELVHGFSDEYLKENGKDPREAIKDFLSFVEGTTIVGHNVNYDMNILMSQSSRLNLPKLNIKGIYDTLDLSRKFYPKLPNHKLETISQIVDTEVNPDHNAMNDILATKDVLLDMIEKIKLNTLQRMNMVSGYKRHFEELASQIKEIKKDLSIKRPYELLAKAVELSNIKEYYKEEPKRINNLRELYKIFKNLDNQEDSSRDSLINLLAFTSLSNSELDRNFSSQKKVPIITIHQAKGLEFDTVFIAGLNEHIFPSYRSIKALDLSEEYRLFYVALTRAKKNLYLSWHRFNKWHREQESSRFIDCIDKEYKSYLS